MSNPLIQRGMVTLVMLSVGAALYASEASPGKPASPNPVPMTGTPVRTPSTPSSVNSGVGAQLKALEDPYKANLASLDQQIAPLRQQIQSAQSSLKPLQDQRETLVTQFESQRASLMEQVEPGYLAAYQQEAQALNSAKSQHDQAIASANQQYTSQRQPNSSAVSVHSQRAEKGLNSSV